MSQKQAPSSVKGGRPRTVCPLGEAGSRVTTYLPATYHDRLIKLAQQHDQSVSAVLRSLLILRLR